LTLEFFEEPVILPSGHVYERKKIEVWLDSHDTDPKTNLDGLTKDDLESFSELMVLVNAYKVSIANESQILT
jgi:U-box domain